MSPRPAWNFLAVAAAIALSACQPKESAPAASVPSEPAANNAFTQNVDRGLTTMNKADSVAARANAQTQQQTEQLQTVDQPQ